MTRVLLVGKGPPERGGIPAFLLMLLSSDLREDYELRLLNLSHAGTRAGGKLTGGNILRTLTDALAVWRGARDVDIVHVHSAFSPAVTIVRAGLLLAAARFRRRSAILHVHGGRLQLWMRGTLRRLLVRGISSLAHYTVCVSVGARDALTGVVASDRLALVENGVPVGRSTVSSLDGDPPRVLYVGILTPRKGILDLLAASRRLRSDGVEHELVLVGGQPDEGQEALAQVMEAVREDVILLGEQTYEEMPDIYAAADLFCLPSWWEAMPLSVLEAMAAGLPVVATGVGDLPHIVVDGLTGSIVPARDPDRLAAELGRLLADPALRRRFGDAGRRRVVERYSLARTTAMIDALYASVTDR